MLFFFSNCNVTAAVDEKFTKTYKCSDHPAVRMRIERLTCSEKNFIENFRRFGSADLARLRDHLYQNFISPFGFPTLTTLALNYTDILINPDETSSKFASVDNLRNIHFDEEVANTE